MGRKGSAVKTGEGYPTRNGIAVPVHEIWLPESDLDPDDPNSFNNHHNAWTKPIFGRFALLKTFRDLETLQFALATDVHHHLHQRYDPPALPTPKQAMTEIERARDGGERLHILVKRKCEDGKERKVYEFQEIDDFVMKKARASYNEMVRRGLS